MPNAFQNIAWPGWDTVGLIGRGSYGAVYEIRRSMLGETETAALKVITIPQNDSDIEEMYCEGYDEESITGSFRNHLKSIVAEYSLMRKMNGCSNIVSCDDVRYVQHEDGIGWDIYIKMELLSPLTKALPEEIPDETVIRIAKDICSALVICKKYDIVHRDIKPQNIFVSPNGDYKLGDFGIAKTIEKTSGGTKIGTYKYMAPEVYHNQPYGVSADIYSLGLVLYWLLNQRRMPFLPLPPVILSAGMDENARLRRLSGEPLPAPASGSKELQAVVLKACAYDPRDRYHSAAEMLEDLEQLDRAPVQEAVPVPYPASYPTQYPNLKGDPDATVGAAFYGIHHQTQKPEPAVQQSYYPDAEATAGPAFHGAHFSQPHAEPAAQQPQQPAQQQYAAQYPDPDATVGNAFYGMHHYQEQPVANPAAGAAFYGMHQSQPVVQQPQQPAAQKPPKKEKPQKVQQPRNEKEAPKKKKSKTLLIVIIILLLAALGAGAALLFFGSGNQGSKAIVSAGGGHCIVINADGSKAVAGDNAHGQCAVADWDNLVDVSAGLNFTIGLRADGSVISTGNNEFQQCAVYEWSNVKAISAGNKHTVALLEDGTVVATGDNTHGQCDVSRWRDIIAISAGGFHTVGLKSDGTVVATGNNTYGACDVSGWRDIIAVSCGRNHTLGLKSDGTVVALGYNQFGQCDVSSWTDIVALSAGGYHSVGLKSDGTVVAVGKTKYGQCNVSGWKNVVAIDAGLDFTVGIKSDGSIVTIGDNKSGQCNLTGRN